MCGWRALLLALGRPRPPHRRLLLGDPDQHHLPVAALGRGRVDQRAGLGLLALALLEVHHRDPVDLGEAMDVFHVAVADLAERRRRRDREPALPAQEPAHLTHRLQLGHIALQEEPVHRPARQASCDPAVGSRSRPSAASLVFSNLEATTDATGAPTGRPQREALAFAFLGGMRLARYL